MIRRWQKNVPLKKVTSFQIGGKARYFAQVFSKEELRETLIEGQKKHLPIFVLGRGTNILVADEGFKGLVLEISLGGVCWLGNYVKAEAGVPLPFLVEEAKKRNLSGLEWATGIPGSLGGAIRGNAGTKEESISQVLEKVEVFNQEQGNFEEYSVTTDQFGYRSSIFQKHPEIIVTAGLLKLKPASREEIEKKMFSYLQARQNQPLDFPSAGSVFKNPPQASAGKLIDQAGLKGKRVGQAQISLRHANFIVNLGGAKSSQVRTLIQEAKTEVKNKFNISLEEEIVILDQEGIRS